MKPILLIVFVIGLIEFAFAQKKTGHKFLIDGKISGQDTGVVRLSYYDASEKYKTDTSRIIAGRFSFTGFINGSHDADISGAVISRSTNDLNFATLFLDQGKMQLQLEKNNFKSFILNGSALQDEALQFEKSDPGYSIEKRLERMYDLASDSARRNNTDTVIKKKSCEFTRSVGSIFYRKPETKAGLHQISSGLVSKCIFFRIFFVSTAFRYCKSDI